ncbi:MAG TPA: RNA polymerase sigma factor [Acidimicrobiales bacterium]
MSDLTSVAASAATDVARPGSDGRRVRPSGGVVRRRSPRRAVARVSAAEPVDLDELVRAARGGDRAAFDDLVRVTYAGTYTLAFRLTGDDDDAGDVVQDTYLRAFRGLRRFRGDAQFTTWLYRITANCASTHLGRRSRHRHDELHDELAVVDLRPGHDPTGRAEHHDLRDRVREAVQALPPKLRAVVVLRDIYDLSHEAIASELGISESAAKVRLHRARRKLRDDVALQAVSTDDGDAARAV